PSSRCQEWLRPRAWNASAEPTTVRRMVDFRAAVVDVEGVRSLPHAATLLIACVACSSSTEPNPVPTGGTTSAALLPLAWTDAALGQDGPAPTITAQGICGSSTETYLSEVIHGDPTQTTVKYDWADIEDGKQ